MRVGSLLKSSEIVVSPALSSVFDPIVVEFAARGEREIRKFEFEEAFSDEEEDDDDGEGDDEIAFELALLLDKFKAEVVALSADVPLTGSEVNELAADDDDETGSELKSDSVSVASGEEEGEVTVMAFGNLEFVVASVVGFARVKLLANTELCSELSCAAVVLTAAVLGIEATMVESSFAAVVVGPSGVDDNNKSNILGDLVKVELSIVDAADLIDKLTLVLDNDVVSTAVEETILEAEITLELDDDFDAGDNDDRPVICKDESKLRFCTVSLTVFKVSPTLSWEFEAKAEGEE